MTQHTKGDGLPGPEETRPHLGIERAAPRNEQMATNKVECNACPVLCQISEGRAGACDRYANQGGLLVRLDAVVWLRRPGGAPDEEQAHLPRPLDTDPGAKVTGEADDPDYFVTGIGASTMYPDYKPAPFIVASKVRGVDMVTVVTEGIFSYCSLKVKIDTDRFLGNEQAAVRYKGEVIGHVTTAEYGSQMLSLGGVHHLTGGSKKEGRLTLEAMQLLGNQHALEVDIDAGAQVVLQAGRAPIVNGTPEQRMRVGCG